MFKRLKVKTGDQVMVIAGEYKGKDGRVMSIDRTKDRLIVEGLNIVTKHIKPSPTNPEGRIEKVEAPIHISNVMVIDGQGNPTRIGRRRGDNGKLGRYSKKSSEDIK